MPPISPEATSVLRRNNVVVSGNPDGRSIIFAHGFGCSQEAWRLVAPRFEAEYRVIVFDNVGAGGSDLAAYDRGKYDSLYGYADDVVEILDELDLSDVVYVGHSVSSMIGVLAAIARPDLIGTLVLVNPSPRYIDDGDYVGGFTEPDIMALLDNLDSNYLGWSSAMAPVIIGNADRPELGSELTASFCRFDPAIARQFARVTFPPTTARISRSWRHRLSCSRARTMSSHRSSSDSTCTRTSRGARSCSSLPPGTSRTSRGPMR